jgi:hypothetical protein
MNVEAGGRLAGRFAVPCGLKIASIVAMVFGIIAAAVGFIVAPVATWVWLVVWFVVFTGIASGMLVWAATFRTAQAGWTASVNRLGHSVIAFFGVCFVVMIVLLAGAWGWVTWLHHPIPAKAAWLNLPFMVIRDIVMLGGLGVLFLILVRSTLRADARAAGGEELSDRGQARMTALGTACVFVYVFAWTVISYDFIMSLSPEWFSTMFAPYIWVTNAYAGLAALAILATVMRSRLGVERYLTPKQFNDLGNLMLGFSLFSMGLFFAQYLTIWYGNLPEETFFLIGRYYRGSWPYLGWSAFFLAYAIPFILLQSRELKHSPKWLSVTSVILLVGIALDRYVLVVPSVFEGVVGLNPIPALSVFFFAGSLLWSVAAFLAKYPAVSTADEALRKRRHMEVIN